jgi:hypothetical protein
MAAAMAGRDPNWRRMDHLSVANEYEDIEMRTGLRRVTLML